MWDDANGTITRTSYQPTHHTCEFCHKEIDKGIIRNNHVYCNLRHAILGALKGDFLP